MGGGTCHTSEPNMPPSVNPFPFRHASTQRYGHLQMQHQAEHWWGLEVPCSIAWMLPLPRRALRPARVEQKAGSERACWMPLPPDPQAPRRLRT